MRARALRILGLALAALAVLALLTVILARTRANSGVEKQYAAYQASLVAYTDTFIEAQSLAPIFDALAWDNEGKDAGPWLNPRISWVAPDGIEDRWRKEKGYPAPDLVLDSQRLSRMADHHKNWTEAPSDLADGLDFSWMERLSSFGYWEVGINSPEDLLHLETELGVPAYGSLTAWVRLRWIAALNAPDGERSAALRRARDQTRHLTRLVLSTEQLQGLLTASSWLNLEGQVAKALPEESDLQLTSLSPQQRKLMYKTMLAALFASPLWDRDEVGARFDGLKIGRCAVLSEALAVASVVAPALEKRRDGLYQFLDQKLEQSECRMALGRLLWQDRSNTAGLRNMICAPEPNDCFSWTLAGLLGIRAPLTELMLYSSLPSL